MLADFDYLRKLQESGETEKLIQVISLVCFWDQDGCVYSNL